MGNVFMRFPDGKFKTLTLSYDDGVEEDIRLVKLMLQHGLKGTFNLNSDKFAPAGEPKKLTRTGHKHLYLSEAREIFCGTGMEVACHGVTHPFFEQLPSHLCVQEVFQDRLNLEEQFGGIVRGMAYPFGTTSDSVVTTLKQCGIAYARTTVSTCRFDMPTDWLRLNPTCHHENPELMALARKFAENKRALRPQMFYLWGHSYEFQDKGHWNIVEEFAEYMGGREDIWYATNLEIYDYVAAYNQLIFSANGKKIFNPTNTTLYTEINDETFCIQPGETIEIKNVVG